MQVLIGRLSGSNQFLLDHEQAGSYPPDTRVGSRVSDFEAEYTWSSGRYVMRAVVLHEYGGPEKLKFEDNVPEPQISGSTVLIAAAAASVNPIDWKLRAGMRQKDSPFVVSGNSGPRCEWHGTAVGANVRHFKAGDRVLALSNATYAELVAVNDSDVTHLPDGVDLANAAAIPLISVGYRGPTCARGTRKRKAFSYNKRTMDRAMGPF
jgi:hypothetical protein